MNYTNSSNSNIVRQLIILVISVVFQVLFFDQMQIGDRFEIFFFMLFIILLPIQIDRLTLLLVCAAYGALLDVLLASAGLISIVTIFIGFIRPLIVRMFYITNDRYDRNLPSSYTMGIFHFVFYVTTILLVSSLIFYSIESMRFRDTFYIILDSLMTTIITLPIIYFTQLIILSTNRRN